MQRAARHALRPGQPTYVLDIPGGHGKVPIGPGYLEPTQDGYVVTDPRGQRHDYTA